MKKLWFIPTIVVLLSTLLTPPANAGLTLPNSLPVVTEMTGTGMNITQKIFGDLLQLNIELSADNVRYFGFGLQFNPSDYELENVLAGNVLKNAGGSLEIGSLFTLKDTPLNTVITLRKKSANWGEIRPQSLMVSTKVSGLRSFEPATAFTPAPRPEVLSLNNFPNPFNPETTIKYSVPSDGTVKLTIYNALGQSVRTLVNERQRAGEYAVKWNAVNDTGQPVANGLYFYQITTPAGDMIRKMLLLK